ncbi:MAG: hypothetical protein MHMPM18_003120 [Marteilia pararefringens]
MSSPSPLAGAAAPSQDQEENQLQQNSGTQSSTPSTSTNSSNLPSLLQSTSIQALGPSSSPIQLLPTANQSTGSGNHTNNTNSDAQVQTANLAPEQSNANAAENPEATADRPSPNSIAHLRQLLRQLDNDLEPLSNPTALWNSVDSLLEVMGSFRSVSRIL